MLRFPKAHVVDADMDVGILEKIVDSANITDLGIFRKWFAAKFCKNGHGYRLDTNDPKTEFKAFIFVVSLTLINVQDETLNIEKIDLLPFVKAFFDSPYFSKCEQAVGNIYFGCSKSQVRSNSYPLLHGMSHGTIF